MSTTDQRPERTAETAADPADASAWAVPGVGPHRPPVSAEQTDRGDHADDLGDLAGAIASGVTVHPIVAAMLTCLETLHGVRDVGAAGLSAREIRLMLLAVTQVAAAVFALRLRLLVAAEVQRVQDLTGATTVATFFAHLTQTRVADARAQARLARDLDRRYPLLRDALANGQMSPEHVQVAVAALRRLPKKQVGPEQVAACQRFLIDAARYLAPDQLRVVGKKLWQVIDPDGAERREGQALEDEEQLARAKAYLRSWRNGDGTTGFRGKLPDLQADMLLKALKAFAAPSRRKNPNIHTGQPDDIHPTGTPAAGDEPAGDPGPGQEEPAPEEPEVPYPVRLGHALIELIERLPAETIPYTGGTAATIVITMRLDQLKSGLGTATTDTGTEVSAAQVRRLSCQAGLVPMVLGGPGQCLDLGQKTRYHTEPIRTAAAVLDQTCAVTGCRRPAAECDYHHPIPFSEGGDTSLTNCAPVCPYHHGLIHSSRWRTTWHGRAARLHRVNRN